MGAQSQKNEWAGVAIAGAKFVPSAALRRAGVTPQILQDADRKIQTRHEYDREGQIRVLFDCLLSHQPIYSAAEIAARAEEPCDERPAERGAAAGTGRGVDQDLSERPTDLVGHAASRARTQRPGARGLANRRAPYVTGAPDRSIARALASGD